MAVLSHVLNHPAQYVTEAEKQTDYSERNSHYIHCLQALEQSMDLDAYVLDYFNKEIIYFTQNCSLRKFLTQSSAYQPLSLEFLHRVYAEEDLKKVEKMSEVAFDFFLSYPIERRRHGAYTVDLRLKEPSGDYTLVNTKISVLDMTADGKIRLTLAVLSYPSSKTNGKCYFKLTDTNKVYEYIDKAHKFIEVNTQKLTPKSEKVLELAGQGKTEPEIARLLGISLHTVKYHKQQIFKQLNVRNIAEAIQFINSQKKMAGAD